MRRLLPLLCLLLPSLASAADTTGPSAPTATPSPPAASGAATYCAAKLPRSLGCTEERLHVLGERLKAELLPAQPNARGTIFMSFTILDNGSVETLKVKFVPGAQGFSNDFLDRVEKIVSGFNFGPADSVDHQKFFFTFGDGTSATNLSSNPFPVVVAKVSAASGGLSVAELEAATESLQPWFKQALQFCAMHDSAGNRCQIQLDLRASAKVGGAPDCSVASTNISDIASRRMYCQIVRNLQLPARPQPSRFSLLISDPPDVDDDADAL